MSSSIKLPPRCPKCNATLDVPRERYDGLPGVKYRDCNSCGYTSPVRSRPKKVRI